MTIFEVLREDHELQRNLLDQLIDTSGNSDERKLVFNKLKHELKIHENAEERFFYTPLLQDEMSQEQARHGIAEHHELDELIEKLEKMDMSSPMWLITAKKLTDEVKHHLEEEEHKFFQIGGKVLSNAKKESLANEYSKYINENRLA